MNLFHVHQRTHEGKRYKVQFGCRRTSHNRGEFLIMVRPIDYLAHVCALPVVYATFPFTPEGMTTGLERYHELLGNFLVFVMEQAL